MHDWWNLRLKNNSEWQFKRLFRQLLLILRIFARNLLIGNQCIKYFSVIFLSVEDIWSEAWTRVLLTDLQLILYSAFTRIFRHVQSIFEITYPASAKLFICQIIAQSLLKGCSNWKTHWRVFLTMLHLSSTLSLPKYWCDSVSNIPFV